MNTRSCSLLLVLCLAGTLGSGEYSCDPPNWTVVCVNEMVKQVNSNKTLHYEWVEQGEDFQMTVPSKIGGDPTRKIKEVLMTDKDLVCTGLKFRGIDSCTITVELNSQWDSLEAEFVILPATNGDDTDYRTWMTLDNAHTSLLTTWKIEEKNGTLSIRALDTRVNITMHHPTGRRDRQVSDDGRQIPDPAADIIDDYKVHNWDNIYEPIFKTAMGNSFKTAFINTFLPHLNQKFETLPVSMKKVNVCDSYPW